MQNSIITSTELRTTLALALLLGGLLPTSSLAQGSLEAWGGTFYGQVTETPTGPGFTQVACGEFHSVAVRVDGSIHSWGRDQQGQVTQTPSGTGFAQVAGGGKHSLALRTDGSIVSWGWDALGQVSNTPSGTGFTQVAAGIRHSIALRADGSLVSWGADVFGVVALTPSGTGFAQVAAAADRSIALRSDGSIVSWGRDDYGQVTNTPGETGFIQVAAATLHSLALRADGSIVAWGIDTHGQVSNAPTGTGFLQVTGGTTFSAAIRPDGSIAYWGIAGYEPPPTVIGGAFTRLACGTVHTVALRTENAGTAYCLGDGTGASCPCSANGQVGEGCANTSAIGGATLSASGDADLTLDTFQLNVVGVPGNKPGLILRGSNQANGGLGTAAGDGLLCTSGQTARSQVQVTSAGITTFSNFQGNPFGASSYGAGATTNYQFWYRDTANTCSGSGFNFSNAWRVTWMP
mgnify:CR=1 FL=1